VIPLVQDGGGRGEGPVPFGGFSGFSVFDAIVADSIDTGIIYIYMCMHLYVFLVICTYQYPE
jgi:hypothetical protein